MTRKTLAIPKFRTEGEEADWWASAAGRAYVKQKAAAPMKGAGSRLLAKLNRKASVQTAIRLPEADIERARELAGRKGIGYQTLLKMVVHEGLQREARSR